MKFADGYIEVEQLSIFEKFVLFYNFSTLQWEARNSSVRPEVLMHFRTQIIIIFSSEMQQNWHIIVNINSNSIAIF